MKCDTSAVKLILFRDLCCGSRGKVGFEVRARRDFVISDALLAEITNSGTE